MEEEGKERSKEAVESKCKDKVKLRSGVAVEPEFSAARTSQDQRGHWQQQRGCLFFQREENQINADNEIKLDASP